jgi:hypothetical protein
LRTGANFFLSERNEKMQLLFLKPAADCAGNKEEFMRCFIELKVLPLLSLSHLQSLFICPFNTTTIFHKKEKHNQKTLNPLIAVETGCRKNTRLMIYTLRIHYSVAILKESKHLR